MTDPDTHFMKIALREARKGIGRTSPNPCVGAVVVKNGRIVSKGYHKKAGTPHAEVHALRGAGKQAKDATIYVTLEPCNHTGRTPPCTRAILDSGIRRVVVGMTDPNPLVAGKGCDFFLEKGIEVKRHVLEQECRELNFPFIKHITTGLPWVIMKAGCSLDGRIAASSGECSWITNKESRAEVHRIRDRVDAILVGVATAVNDNPSLTTRLKGKKGRDPLRVILDSSLRLVPSAKMLGQQSETATWIFCSAEADSKKKAELENAGAKVIPVKESDAGGVDLEEVLRFLGKSQINSLLVEGGGRIHGAFLRAGLVDQVNLFLAPIFLGSDAIAVVDELAVEKVQDCKRFVTRRTRRFGDDIMVEGIFSNS